ncbi:MAG: S49 family peptidase [Bacteroidales bacterium]|nr:S49 family peptidase [Bacteroidales bacterium]
MNKKSGFWKSFFIAVLMVLPMVSHAQNGKKLVYQFAIDEEIAPPASLRVEKAMEEAKEIKADIIVVHINTFGGTLDDADKIRTAFLESEIPIYAYIDNNAASAGALISIACDSIYMHSGSSIGAATVVNQTGEVQPDKYQSYMRSLMRATAEARGRRPDIAQAMVDPDIFVAGISDSGKVLTFTTSEAVQYGFCEAEVENVKTLLSHAGVNEYTIQEQRYTFIDKVIGFLVNPIVSGLLIMLIIGGIYFELQQPGIGFPLILALSAAALYFAPLYLDGLATYWEIIIFIIGLVLIALEIFVFPGFGVSGVMGIICVVTGLAFSMVGNVGFDFSGVPTGMFGNRLMVTLVSFAVALPLSMYLGKKLFESTLFGGLALNTVQNTNEGYTVAVEQEKTLMGKEGIAATILRPAGKIVIDGKYYDAVAQISYIEKGTPVEVIDYVNGSLVVNIKG